MFLHPSLLCLDKPTSLHVVLTIANAFHELQIMEDAQHRSTSGLELLNQIADSDLAMNWAEINAPARWAMTQNKDRDEAECAAPAAAAKDQLYPTLRHLAVCYQSLSSPARQAGLSFFPPLM